MGSVDRSDRRKFRTDFTPEGVAVLREKVNEKLKEYMGDYTDDTLVEYVIVLLRNGRDKDQAKNELNVFLGDDSDSFVAWLWDHLALNIDLYVQSKELHDEAPKRKLISKVQAGGDGVQHLNSQSERVESTWFSRSRRNRDWKGLIGRETDAPPLLSSELDNVHLEENDQSKVNRGPRLQSPPSPVQRKRGREVDQQKTKRDSGSQVTIHAPRRLLQFAVRDAVATSRPYNPGTPVEPSLKRLRSVVSTSADESSLVQHHQRMQTTRVSNPMSTVIRAVTEAADDAVKFRSPGSVFDRLGRNMNQSDSSVQLDNDYRHQEQSQPLYLQRSDYNDQYAGNTTMFQHEGAFLSDSTSDDEGFDDVNVMGHRVSRASQLGSSGGNRGDDSLMMHYSVAKNDDDNVSLKQNRDQEQPAVTPNTSKIVNISVNVNTWKPPGSAQCQEPRKVAELDGQKTLSNSRSDTRLVKENAKDVKTNHGNVNSSLDLKNAPQKAQLSTAGPSADGRLLEDADSRTIFVSNVHFAATKDGVSRHFNKFGEVLKVVIVTDVTTGQPKGAAYVEFMSKKAADNALSLDGTSFMSRILKVVRKSAAPREYAPTLPFPRGVRGSPFPSARFSRAPFPRGVIGAFSPRPPIKFGSRSLQWKRDSQGISPDSSAASNNSNISSPAARGFTYVRTEPKIDGGLNST